MNVKLLVVTLTICLISSCKKEINIEQNPLIGTWKISSEQSLDIRNGDTIENTINADNRYFEFKKDSILIVYWNYPNLHDESIWYKKGNDSLYVFFDGPASNIIYKFKYQQVSDSKMLWEQIDNISNDDIQKKIYEVIKE